VSPCYKHSRKAKSAWPSSLTSLTGDRDPCEQSEESPREGEGMLTLCTIPHLGWLFLVVATSTMVVSIVWAWRLGKASYLDNLKKKHFEEWGYSRDSVSTSLNHIAAKLGRGYQMRDNVIKSLGEGCTKRNWEEVELFGNALVETTAKIDRLRTERHEAEATAKLMGFGQLVDDIHAKGIPSPEQSPK